jgi:FtsP/CotA-like multicopper oxidase with cupredoxin domain
MLITLVTGIFQLVTSLPRLPLPRPAPGAIEALANNNTRTAGTLEGRTLTLALEVIESGWHPEGEDDPDVPILAFAEAGRGPEVPGPLIRVRQGTEIHLTITNRSDSTLTLGGFRPRATRGALDTLSLAPGATRELRFRLDAPGTYWYWGAMGSAGWDDREWLDSQLNGAIVVDPVAGSAPDRIFVISEWFLDHPDRPFENVLVINGKAFPHTERLTMAQGDSARYRVINAVAITHPMHLHGFYFRITARGEWDRDDPLPPARQPLENTHLMDEGSTLSFAFKATTPGNWLFHCHFAFHVDDDATLVGAPGTSAAGSTHGHSMRGLVMGLTVTPSPVYREDEAADARKLRLLVQQQAGRLTTGHAAIGFVLQGENAPRRDSVSLPAPVLDLEKGKPVRITVVNNLDEPTGVHWHGLEIESFPDGVPDWSGLGDRIFRPIAPGDSFVAAFTPPRAGTFPYHSHLNERQQMISGMYGAIIVRDKPRDPARDHLILVGGGGPEINGKIESPYALVNGRRTPRALRLAAGATHRLRIVSIHPDWRIVLSLRNDTTIARWRAVAKDGADLPPAQATARPANLRMGPGETADFEWTPRVPGRWRMEIRTVEPGWYIPLDVIVESRKP